MYTLLINADKPPNLEMPTATFAGAPLGTSLKPGKDAVGMEPINISPKQTTSPFVLLQPSVRRSSDLPVSCWFKFFYW